MMHYVKQISMGILASIFLVSCADKRVETRKKTHPLLLISFDGFRHDYLSKADTPNFDQFIKEGVQAEGLIPVFPSTTFPIVKRLKIHAGKGEPIWNTAEKQGLKAGTLFWVGSEAPLQHMRPTHWKPYDESMPFKARIDTVVKWLRAPEGQSVNLATLYFCQLDHGMTELSADKIINLDQIIDSSNIERRVFGPVTMINPKKGKK